MRPRSRVAQTPPFCLSPKAGRPLTQTASSEGPRRSADQLRLGSPSLAYRRPQAKPCGFSPRENLGARRWVLQQQKQYIDNNIIIYFAYITAQWLVFKKPRSKAQEQEQDQERGIPGYPCTVTVYQWEVCSLAKSVAKKTG